MEKPSLLTLSNGLRLVVQPMPQVDSLSVVVGVRAGSRDEAKKNNGLFHFIEHMAFKGTKKRPSSFAITSLIDSVGAEMNAFTGKELTGYWLRLNSAHRELAFDILADILTNSLLKSEEIERERGVIIEEINMYEDLPMRRVMEVFERTLYGNNSMGWSIAGEKETIRQIQRQDFLDYLERLYFPANMVVAMAGKITLSQAKKLAQKYFSSLQKRGQKVSNGIRKEVKIKQAGSRLKLVSKKTEQAHFCLGVPGYSLKHPDRYALALLSTILGGGMSSRLFIQVRERRGLAYYVGSLPEFFTDSGYLLARAGVKIAKAEEAIKVSLAEFADLRDKPVKAKELTKAKEFNKGHLILALEDSSSVANRYLGQLLLEEKIRSVEKTLKLIDQVTVKQVQRVARDVFRSEKLNLAVIGPYQDKNRFQKQIKNF